jgi:hypothetical protein
MKQKDVFDKIGEIIQELTDQYDFLQMSKDNLNDLELELFVANAHFLTDHIGILRKLNSQKNVSQKPLENPEVTNEKKYFEPVVQQMKYAAGATKLQTLSTAVKQAELESGKSMQEEHSDHKIDIGSEIRLDTYAVLREEPETIRHELILDESDYQDDENTSGENVMEKDKEMNVGERPTTALPISEYINTKVSKQMAETINKVTPEEVITINQKISSQLGEKITSQTEQSGLKPISDIKLAITLNDKLLFVRDLFNGYNLAYSEAIEILNRFNTFEEASRFLNTNYVTKNDWKSKPATTEKLYEILKRRYT